MPKVSVIRVGTAGWSIPRLSSPHFDASGSHLQRYSRRLGCAEINSSFYRSHAAATYAKWRDGTPPHFRFSVKVPRAITHERGLRDARELLVAFIQQTNGLGEKRGPLLVQLPPSLHFEEPVVTHFLKLVRAVYHGVVVCEPRHVTWFSPTVESLLRKYEIGRVAADPAVVPSAAEPGGWSGVVYFRLHGSPRKYWSRYERGFLATLAARVEGVASADEVWCVFDNTASGAAAENACELSEQLAISALPENGDPEAVNRRHAIGRAGGEPHTRRASEAVMPVVGGRRR